jgi:cell division protein FtsN
MSKAGVVLILMGMSILPVAVVAQVTVPSDPAYRRAQAMVNDGNAQGGRAVVDSMLARAAPGSNEFAEGLYWRAVLASTAAEAEMDYRRIIVDHPSSPRVEDVLLRLAQLEVARANYDAALLHLTRLTTEHPEGASRARASYWTARVLFEKNDSQRACIANADALARTTEDQAELRNQITYLNQRCAGVALTTEAPALAVNPQPANPQPVATVPEPTAAAVTVTPKPAMRPPDKPLDTSPTMLPTPPITTDASAERAVTTKPTTSRPPTTKSATTSGSGYTIQVAAYNVKSQAQTMATRLKQRGYEARVSGTSAPYRVRIGRYDSRTQAAAVLRSLKAKSINGIVVQAEAR